MSIDYINKPPHYQAFGFESIKMVNIIVKEITWNGCVAAYVFNAIKYCIRAKYKNNFNQDKEKALFYIKAIIKEYEKNKNKSIKNTYKFEDIIKIENYLQRIAEKDKKLSKILKEIINENFLLAQQLIKKY
ncbi:DUF3310 domain-containing protein [Campylobacter jejuni]|uniref:DUF3310 domain-containing protein n=1 Tax=Campylobacter jejuni TaxID=197 RepID=UPI00089389DC|nr:DUF3310 domain-containing protein [Campylobacter jejuni]EJF7467885.1 DUF3310 domain-containing protein [Campylobacter coli]OEZ15214.1 hypothetical protein A0L49_08600 [Campylobacter jejuni]HEG2942042.1 DUF3310 domain-containing protein [Campylobacter jejuni]